MCGQYGRRSDKQSIADAFHVDAGLDEVDFAPNLAIPPGSMQPVIQLDDNGDRRFTMMYWGFNFPGRFVFNARTDKMDKPGLWRNSIVEGRRCIIPADYFVEWKHIQKKNNPKYEISVPGLAPFGFAGLWSTWKNKAGESLPSMAIITTEPNARMAQFHDRQPVILNPSEYTEWLAPSERPPLHLLRILPEDKLAFEQVGGPMQLELGS